RRLPKAARRKSPKTGRSSRYTWESERAVLEVSNVCSSYGRMQVLWDVSLSVGEGEIVALVGANGAGKTTLLKTISGLLPPVSGDVIFMGERITASPPHQIVEMGIAYVPEGGRVFPDMTVRENLD